MRFDLGGSLGSEVVKLYQQGRRRFGPDNQAVTGLGRLGQPPPDVPRISVRLRLD
jgi:hypothetical protein